MLKRKLHRYEWSLNPVSAAVIGAGLHAGFPASCPLQQSACLTSEHTSAFSHTSYIQLSRPVMLNNDAALFKWETTDKTVNTQEGANA